jgi:capsid portal protein
METNKFAIIENRTKVIPVMKEAKITGKKYISYGENNHYPEYLFSLYQNSTILQSVINGIVDYAVGQGVKSLFLSEQVNTDGETWDDVMKNITLDFMVTDGFAINVLRDAENRISELYWLDVSKVRLSEDGLTGYYSENGFSWGDKPQELPIFDPKKKQKSSIFYYKGSSRGLYPIPRWSGAIKAVETSCEISNYHLNSILNNFNPAAIISFNNGVPDKATQEAIEKKINKKFVGSDNVNRFILSFSESGENQTTVQTLGTDNADAKFHTLKDSIQEEIFIAFRATPALFGLNPENNGFSKQEFLESFQLFYKTVIEPIQKTLNKSFGKIFDTTNPLTFNKLSVWDDKITTVDNEQ